MRFVISLFAACLISTPVSARSDRGMKEQESVIDEKTKRRLQNNYNSTKEMIRELWEFDYDDLFLELTLTDHPSTNPSLSVKPSPLPPGSIYPTSSPTSHAHSLSLMIPSDKPSPPPSLELTGVPSREVCSFHLLNQSQFSNLFLIILFCVLSSITALTKAFSGTQLASIA